MSAEKLKTIEGDNREKERELQEKIKEQEQKKKKIEKLLREQRQRNLKKEVENEFKEIKVTYSAYVSFDEKDQVVGVYTSREKAEEEINWKGGSIKKVPVNRSFSLEENFGSDEE